MSESECEFYQPGSTSVQKTKSNRKQMANNGKRKSGSLTNSTCTSKKPMSSTDIFGISSNHGIDTELTEGTSGNLLSSFFVNRVANGNERRTTSTVGEYYIDCKVYKTSDARDTDSLELWKKALVRIKFHADTDSHQWRKLQEFVRSADLLFEEQPKPPKSKPWPDKSICNYSDPYEDSCATIQNEDCLYLSIYKPLRTEINIPIIVWNHEHSLSHGPDFLIDEEVIVIAVSFRIGIFGFLNTGDHFARGNMGAKDMLAALRWIRGNISYFGGDVNKVTVIGSGKAASSVASFLLSPAGDELYTRLIIQSDSALSPAYYKNYNFEISNKLYWNLNGPYNKFNRTELYEILTSSPTNRLSSASTNLFDSTEVRDDQRLITAFGPTVEPTSKAAFMNKFPFDVYKWKLSNNAGVLIGYTSLEALHKLAGFVHNMKLLKYLNYNFQYLLPFEGRKDVYESRRYREIRRKIMDFYFVNGTIGERSLRRYAKYVSDQVIYPVLRQAILQAQATCNKVYLYRFSHRSQMNVGWQASLRHLNLSGATAGDEICYQFRCKTLDVYKNDNGTNDKLIVKKVARLWANFAKFGDPTPSNDQLLEHLKWEPLVGDRCLRAMNFGKKIKMVDLPEQKRMKFWDSLKHEYFDEE